MRSRQPVEPFLERSCPAFIFIDLDLNPHMVSYTIPLNVIQGVLGQIVPLRNLGYCRTIQPNLHDNLALLLITPSTTMFLPQNIDAHRNPRISHVFNDVVKDAS